MSKEDFNSSIWDRTEVDITEYFSSEKAPRVEKAGISYLEYTLDELALLGNGDRKRGVHRVMAAIELDPRPVEQRQMDPRRPLQDVLDALMPPALPERQN